MPDPLTLPLLRDLERLTGAACPSCAKRLCGHEALTSIALGFKNAPRCLACLARGLHRPVAELASQMAEYVQRRDCYRQAWDVASDREGVRRGKRPSCLKNLVDAQPHSPAACDELTTEPPAGYPQQTASWDAGDMACGDLVLALRGRVNALPPGGVLQVTARDPAAPEDLPAWCRLTGHRLLRAAHPDYFIRRKEP
jgi:tRNA 2-thiouridine synthesizing protein A